MPAKKRDTKIIERIKRGRRTYGAIYEHSDGRKLYLAWRRQSEIYRSGEVSIAAAIRAGIAAWAIDHEHLIMMKTRKIEYVGILVKESGDIFLTKLTYFFDKSKTKILNFEERGGSLQGYLPLKYFRRRPGRTRL